MSKPIEANLAPVTTSSTADKPAEEVDMSILLELGSIGAGHAATSLSDILQQPITINVPRIHTIDLHLIPGYFNLHDSPTTAVYLQLKDKYGMDILLMFEQSEARKIAAMMSMCGSVEELDAAMETSAIQELANILIGSFLSSISDFCGLSLMPTTPDLVTDGFDAIIDNFLIKQTMFSESAMLFETQFKRNGEDAKSILMIFPSSELKNLLIEKSKSMMG
jgi:chemotaxis protein CheC